MAPQRSLQSVTEAMSYSGTLLDQLSLDLFRIADQFVEIVDIADELLSHAGIQPLLLINQRINRIATVSESAQRIG